MKDDIITIENERVQLSNYASLISTYNVDYKSREQAILVLKRLVKSKMGLPTYLCKQKHAIKLIWLKNNKTISTLYIRTTNNSEYHHGRKQFQSTS